jgi:hypothetical protein
MNPAIRSLGPARSAGREIFVMELADLKEFPSELVLPCPRFVLLIAADFSATPADRSAIAERILNAGCVYLCTWGPSCELMDDLMDEALVVKQLDASGEGATVMTTWHADERLAEAVGFALKSAELDIALAEGCEATVLISVTPLASAAELEAAARRFLAP